MKMYKFGIRGEEDVLFILKDSLLFSNIKLVPGSGNKTHKKEDIKGDNVLIQVKTTLSQSYRISLRDVLNLISNSQKVNLIPIFCVYFSNRKFLKIFVPLEYLNSVISYLTLDYSKLELLLNDKYKKLKVICGDESRGIYANKDIELLGFNHYDFK